MDPNTASVVADTTSVHKRSSSGSGFTSASPSLSMYSRGHSSRSSASSVSTSSSPLPPRDSFDLYGSTKRLEDVREEPQERDDEWAPGDDVYHTTNTSLTPGPSMQPAHTESHFQPEYSLGDQDAWSTTSSGQHHPKRQRSMTDRNSIAGRVSTRFGSLSRRWKNRSSIGPQLSIITQPMGNTQRSGSATSSQIVSPALSAISKHESYLPVSPIQSSLDDAFGDPSAVPIFMDMSAPDEEEENQDQAQATTPLLPPLVMNMSSKRDSPLQSPLQSPAIAPTPYITSSRVSMDAGHAGLPSPPLSTQPSMASMYRSRAGTLSNDIPPLHLDTWDVRLGHANFSIHPEPYMPETIDVDSYKEFRANWEQARKQYSQHLARTIEHYGETSKVYRLTQEKWDAIDHEWKAHDAVLFKQLSPVLARISDSETDASDSLTFPNMLEKPLTRVVVPAFDQSGKFPEIGDADIVGPMASGPPKVAEMQRRSPTTPPDSPRSTRNLFRYLSEILGRHN